MAKSFKKFRDEWDEDDDYRIKDRKMETLRQKRREKASEKLSNFDVKEEDKKR